MSSFTFSRENLWWFLSRDVEHFVHRDFVGLLRFMSMTTSFGKHCRSFARLWNSSSTKYLVRASTWSWTSEAYIEDTSLLKKVEDRGELAWCNVLRNMWSSFMKEDIRGVAIKLLGNRISPLRLLSNSCAQYFDVTTAIRHAFRAACVAEKMFSVAEFAS